MKATVTRTGTDGKEPQPKMTARAATPAEVEQAQRAGELAALAQALDLVERGRERRAVIGDLQGRKGTLEQELREIKGRLAAATAARDLARAGIEGGGDLADLRAKVGELEQAAAELAGAVDALDCRLAELDPGTQYGKYKHVAAPGMASTGRAM